MSRHLGLLWFLVVLASCGAEPGSFGLYFTWDKPPDVKVWIWVRVEERTDPAVAGPILGSDGPQGYVYGDKITLSVDGVSYGDNRVVVAEVREGANPNLPILYYGLSEQFSLVVDEDTVIEVPLTLSPPETAEFDSSIELWFGDQQPEVVGDDDVVGATLVTTSFGAVAVVLANNASFSAGLQTIGMDETDRMKCAAVELDEMTVDECTILDWDLTVGYEDEKKGAYSVFAKFVDRYGYESEVRKDTVVVDRYGPKAIVASLSPAIVKPGDRAYLTITFDELLGSASNPADLTPVPSLFGDSAVEGPEKVGDSTAYRWTIDIDPAAPGGDTGHEFKVDTKDSLDNELKDQDLLDESKLPVALVVDALPPVVHDPESILYSGDQFALKDKGELFSFDFEIVEANALLTPADNDCNSLCPIVRLGNQVVGEVTRNPADDEGKEKRLAFHFEYEVDPGDWQNVQGDLDVAINWTDLAGNKLEYTLPAKVHFDFVRPFCHSWVLVPDFGNMNSKFTYALTANEPLSEMPELQILAESEGLFTEAPAVNGTTYTWEQFAAGVPNQTFSVAARLVDEAGNVSGDDAEDWFVCGASAAVDGEPPKLSQPELSTIPPVKDAADNQVLVVRHEGIVEVFFVVEEAGEIADDYPKVSLSVPGNPIEFAKVSVDQIAGSAKWDCKFNLELDEVKDLEAEGSWPVRVALKDKAENLFIEDSLGGKLVTLDFTAPDAECSLIPPPIDSGYTIGQKVMLQISPLEVLQANSVPLVQEDNDLDNTPQHFDFEEESSYRFAYGVEKGDGEFEFSLMVQITDLVGNQTPPGSTACTQQTQGGYVDGIAPEVHSVEIIIDDIPLDPTLPLKEGVVATAIVHIDNTKVQPDAKLGNADMSPVGSEPSQLGEDLTAWQFTRVIDKQVGEGLRKISVEGVDEAGNFYQYVEEDKTVTTDFTPPKAQCKSMPPSAKIGSSVIVTVNTTEPLKQGKPQFDSNLTFVEPQADTAATTFDFFHAVDDKDVELATWYYTIKLEDLAGNQSEGEFACEGGGKLDAEVPTIDLDTVVIETDPIVYNQKQEKLLAVGDSDWLKVGFVAADNQEMADGYPKVYLDYPGEPIVMTESAQVDLGQGAKEYQFAVQMNALEHDQAQGYWPIRIVLQDAAGNLVVLDAVLDKLIRVDFKAPTAQCKLVPVPGDNASPIGQTINLQITPFEELEYQFQPIVLEGYLPDFDNAPPGSFFKFSADSSYEFFGTVAEVHGERKLSINVHLTDMVGNSTLPLETACGEVLSVDLDGVTPDVVLVDLFVDEIPVDENTGPLNQDRFVSSVVRVTNTQAKPEVRLGSGAMESQEDAPTNVGDEEVPLWEWLFERELTGNEGEGEQKISVHGADEAGNPYAYTEETITVVLDFTPPSAQCSMLPPVAKDGDTIAVTVNTSEPLKPGKPELLSALEFKEPAPDYTATQFQYSYAVTDAEGDLAGWDYKVKLVDAAGNANAGEFACQGSGTIDAVPPTLDEISIKVYTDPIVENSQGGTVKAVGPGDSIFVEFKAIENQGLAEGFPEVTLNVPGSAITFATVQEAEDGEVYSGTYQLTMSKEAHAQAEGVWPVRVVLMDEAGNVTVVDKLGGDLIEVDFTAPAAQCSLVPPPTDVPYAIDAAITLQITPLEELEKNSMPDIEIDFTAKVGNPPPAPFFTHEPGTKYRYARKIGDADGEHAFEIRVSLTDLVGNATDTETACEEVLAGAIDGVRPNVDAVTLTLDQEPLDPSAPIMAGRTLGASVTVTNTTVKPTVHIGAGTMTADAQVPDNVGTPENPLWQWEFARTLQGNEGEGSQLVAVDGTDEAGNSYSNQGEEHTALLDFTPPSAECSSAPPFAKWQDDILVTVQASEKLAGGLPVIDANLAFIEPPGDPDATTFVYTYKFDEPADQNLIAWTFKADITDVAGNKQNGEFACQAGGDLDGVAPAVTAIDVVTDPIVETNDNQVVNAVGDSDDIVATFKVNEAQDVHDEFPNVYLDVPGQPIEFDSVQKAGTYPGEVSYTATLKMHTQVHGSAEGIWPVRVELADLAGNTTVVDKLAGKLVEVDFTAPTAECGLVPPPTDIPYAIGEVVTLQITPLEELEKGTVPLIDELFMAQVGDPPASPFFLHEQGTKYRFSREVNDTDGEHDFEIRVSLTDLVGNVTKDETACSDVLSGSIDGIRPTVQSLALAVDGQPLDPAEPLMSGRTLGATVRITNTKVKPTVLVGSGTMTSPANEPVNVGTQDDPVWQWEFGRKLLGTEGEGSQPVAIKGEDYSGNQYSNAGKEKYALLDFTPPTAKCSASPALAKWQDDIFVTVQTSEALSGGLPAIDANVAFVEPPADPDATTFVYSYKFDKPADQALTAWTLKATLTDSAGNSQDGQFACSAGGNLDGVSPVIQAIEVVTAPVVETNDNKVVKSVGDTDDIIAKFTVNEAQGVPGSFPRVYLDVPGQPIEFDSVNASGNYPGIVSYTAALEMHYAQHLLAEGIWPVRVLVADTAGNLVSDDKLADALVTVDFTPPTAECALVPTLNKPYAIGAKVVFQVFPLEELEKGSKPVLTQTLDGQPTAFLTYDAASEYTYSGTVADNSGEHELAVAASLTDLVGNKTQGQTACKSGVVKGQVDGLRPTVGDIELTVDGQPLKPDQPMMKGRVVKAIFNVTSTDEQPTAQLGSGTMVLDPAAQNPSGNGPYKWTFMRTLQGNEGEGLQKVSVSGADKAGNAYAKTEQTNLALLDFTPPTTECLVNLQQAKLDETVRVTVIATEKLQGVPTFSDTGVVFKEGVHSPDALSPTYVFEYTVGAVETDWTFKATATDTAGNVQPANMQCASSGSVDGKPLVLVGEPTVDAAFLNPATAQWVSTGQFAKHDSKVTVTFSVDEEPAEKPTVLVGDQELAYVSLVGLKYTYEHTFSYPEDSVGTTVKASTVKVLDAAGNETLETLGTVIFDFDDPELAGTGNLQRCDNYVDASPAADKLYLRAQSKANSYGCAYSFNPPADCGEAGSVVAWRYARASFSLDEPVDEDSMVIKILDPDTNWLSGALDINPCESSSTQFQALYDIKATEPKDKWLHMMAYCRDLAGNDAAIKVGEVYFDFDLPASPDVETSGTIRYYRFPYGSWLTAGSTAFRVQGLEGAAPVDCRVRFYDGAITSQSQKIGETSSLTLADGKFGGAIFGHGVELVPADRARVYTASIDRAGNLSDADLTTPEAADAVQVRDVYWFVTMKDKTAGSTIANPATFKATKWFQNQLHQTDYIEYGESSGISAKGGAKVTTTAADFTWRLASPLPSSPKQRSSMALAYDSARGKTVLYGGSKVKQTYKDTWEWDGHKWVKIVPLDPGGDGNPPGGLPTLAYDSLRGVALLYGGLIDGMDLAPDIWAWDGKSWDMLTPDGDQPDARYDHGMAFDSGRGVLVVYGGRDIDNNKFADTWEWDGTGWTEIAPTGGVKPGPLYGAGMAYDTERGVTVLFGGYGNSGRTNDVWEWNGKAWTKKNPSGSKPANVSGPGLVYDAASKRVMHFGGSLDSSGYGGDVWEWNGTSWAKITVLDPEKDGSPTMRRDHAMAYDAARSEVVLFGGYKWMYCEDDENHCFRTWLWDGSSWREAGPDGPDGGGVASIGELEDHAMAYDPARNRTVLHGGTGSDGGTYEWNGARWTKIAPTDPESDGNPEAKLRDHAMTFATSFAPFSNHVVLFGGRTSSTQPISDLWMFDGKSWDKYNAYGTDPTARVDPGIAFDTSQNRMVMFGGEQADWKEPNDTWEAYKSTLFGFPILRWQKITPSGTIPSGREGHSMSYDAKRKRSIVYGEKEGATQDVFEYDAAANKWYKVTKSDPEGDGHAGARGNHATAYDSVRQTTLLFGGNWGDELYYTDFWEWNGSSWHELALADPEVDADPTDKVGHAMAFNTYSSELLMYGGDPSGDETWVGESGFHWARPTHHLAVPFKNAGACKTPVFNEVSVQWTAGGRAYSPSKKTWYNGARVWYWDQGKWVSTGKYNSSHLAPSDLNWKTTDQATLNRLFVGDQQTVNFSLWTRGYNRYEPATIVTDYVEVMVNYRMDADDAASCE